MSLTPVLDAYQAKLLDEKTMLRYGFSSDMLMELAGSKIADFLTELPETSYLFLVGFGNNGGDALVAARHLSLKKSGCSITLLEIKPDSPNPLYQQNKKRLLELIDNRNINVISALPDSFQGCVVDGLFGSGLNRDMDVATTSLIASVNTWKSATRVAIDVPSGLNATTGKLHPIGFQADFTITVGFKKTGFFLEDGPSLCGKVVVIAIGFDISLIKQTYFEIGKLVQKNRTDEKPLRKHKYDDGWVSIVAGSEGLTGAAYFAAKAAIKAGAAAVQLIYPAGLAPVFDILLPDVIKKPIGTSQDSHFKAEYATSVIKLLNANTKQIIVIGPGIGRNEETTIFLKTCFEQLMSPLLIDADALHALAQKTIRFSQPVCLTPHIGELRSLTKSDVQSDWQRVKLTQQLGSSLQCFVFSKGTTGFMVAPNEELHFLPFTNEKYRKTGFGDVFAGWMAAKYLQNLSFTQAFAQTALEIQSIAENYSLQEFKAEYIIH